ncbi:hypothetical protein ACFQ6U_26935 [Streptomyces sp. NPDC056465]|uniref:hypothetical protein n=1 Tax=Streptomyces sp. NPDC056465 TaxID=3345829 RepID=UPI0036808D61
MTDTTPAAPVTPTQLLHLVGHAEKRRLTPDKAARLCEGMSPGAPEPPAPDHPFGASLLFGLALGTAHHAGPDLPNTGPLLGRRILTVEEQDVLWAAVAHLLGSAGHRPVPFAAVRTVVRAALNQFGILLPPPAPDPGTCPNTFADHQGAWWQCRKSMHHDPTEGHAAREWVWADENSGRAR